MLVRNHYQDIYSYCVRRAGYDAAADLTQEVFLKLVRTITVYRFAGKFRNFLFTIAVNTCNDSERKRRVSCAVLDDEPVMDEGSSPLEEAVTSEQARRVRHAIDALPSIQKDAIILHYYHGLKAGDIASVTGVSLPAAKSRLKQGMDKLRNALREEVCCERPFEPDATVVSGPSSEGK